MRWIKVTDVGNRPVWVNVEHCTRISFPLPNVDVEGACGHIDLLVGVQSTKETPQEIYDMVAGDMIE